MRRDTNKSKKRKIWIGISVAIVIIIFFFIIKSIFFSKTEEKGYNLYTITEMVPLKLEGKVAISDTRDILFDPTLGKITEINVENGQEVEKDTPLLTYTNKEIAANETTQEGALERNYLQVQQAQENVDLANQKYNDAADKVDKAKQKVSAAKSEEEKAALNEEVQQLNSALVEAASAVTQANQALQLANSDATSANNTLEQTREQLTTVVNAPIGGQVTVDESAMNSSEKPVIKIATQTKNIKGKVTEYDYDKIQKDAEVTVTTVGSDKSATGKVIDVAQTPIKQEGADSKTANYQITIEGEFPWAEGLSTTISVPQKEMVVPVSAIQKDGEKEVVFVYKDGKVKKKTIETEMNLGRKIVKSGLNWKEKLILNPDKELKDNQEVQVVKND